MAGDRDSHTPFGAVSRRSLLLGTGKAAAAVAVGSALAAPAPAAAQPSTPPAPTVDPDLGLHTVRMRVNGTTQVVNVEARWTLIETLRDKLGLTGTKLGC